MKEPLLNPKIGSILMLIGGLVAFAFLLVNGPIQQDLGYHKLSDELTYLGIPNFWNVVSNLPFFFVGLWGIWNLKVLANTRLQYLAFFSGIALVSLGSSYYHFTPTNATLIWDRLPMTIAFMAIFSIVISEYISYDLGRKMLFVLVLLGIGSVVYWHFFDDLRWYALIQFFPLFAIPIILLSYKGNYTLAEGYWFLIGGYLLAKVFEIYDTQIHESLGFISGHSLKHLTAAVGLYALLDCYIKRKFIIH